MSRGTLKSKGGANYQYTSVPMVIRLKLFFAELFLSISSVSTGQSQNCVKSTVSAKQVRGDPYWQSNLTHFSHSIEILAKENLLQKHKERVENLPQPDNLIKFVRMQDS